MKGNHVLLSCVEIATAKFTFNISLRLFLVITTALNDIKLDVEVKKTLQKLHYEGLWWNKAGA